MEEFDYAWGEVEKGIRDSFRQGRENKRNRNTAESWNLAQREIDSRPSQVSSPPKRTVQRRIKPAQTPNAVSAPPAPAQEVTGEPTSDTERSNFGAGSDLNAQINPVQGKPNEWDYSQGFPPQKPELGEAPQAASPIESTGIGQGGFEGDRLSEEQNDMDRGMGTWGRGLYEAVNEKGTVTHQEADDEMERFEAEMRGQLPPINTPTPTLAEALPKLSPIDAEIKETTEAIDISDGVNNTPDTLNALEGQTNHLSHDDENLPLPTNTDHWNKNQSPEEAAKNEEALNFGMDAMRQKTEEPAPAPMQQSVAPEEIPPYEEVAKTPASKEPQIKESVREPAPEPVPKAEPKWFTDAMATPKKVDEESKEAHAKEVRSKMAPNAERPKDPKAAEPKAKPKPDNTIKDPFGEPWVEPKTSKKTTIKPDKKAEPEPPNPTDKLPKASPKAKETAANIEPAKNNDEHISFSEYNEKHKAAWRGDEEAEQWINNNRKNIEGSGHTVRDFNPKNAKTHKPDETVSAVASKKVNEPAGKADNDVEEVMGKKQPTNPIPKAKPKAKPKLKKKLKTTKTAKTVKETVKDDDEFGLNAGKITTASKDGIEDKIGKSLNWDDLKWLNSDGGTDLSVLTDKIGRPAIGGRLDPQHIAMTTAMPQHIAENFNERFNGREALLFPTELASGRPFAGGMGQVGAISGKATWTDEEGGPLPPKPKGLKQWKPRWLNMDLPMEDPIYQGVETPRGGGSKRDMWATKFGLGDKNNVSNAKGLHRQGARLNNLKYNDPRSKQSSINRPKMRPLPILDFPKTQEIEIKDLVDRLKEHGGWSKTQNTTDDMLRIGDSLFDNTSYAKDLHDMLNARPKLDLAQVSTGTNFPLRVQTLGGENYDEAGDYRNRNILSHLLAPRVAEDTDYKSRTNILEDI